MGAKQPKGPSTDECLKQMSYIHTMDYYSSIQKKEVELTLEKRGFELRRSTYTQIVFDKKYYGTTGSKAG